MHVLLPPGPLGCSANAVLSDPLEGKPAAPSSNAVRVNTRTILEVHKRVFKFLPKVKGKKQAQKVPARRRKGE